MTRDELFNSCILLAYDVAYKLFEKFNRMIDYDDIKQLALIALWNCADRYINDGRASFPTFARKSVWFDVLRQLLRNEVKCRIVRWQWRKKIVVKHIQTFDFNYDLNEKDDGKSQELRAKLSRFDDEIIDENRFKFLYDAINRLDRRYAIAIMGLLKSESYSTIGKKLKVSRQRAHSITSYACGKLVQELGYSIEGKL